MAISVHLISIPAEEVVTSRVVYLPENGGEFGRAPTCDIPLPDQGKRISRVHGKIERTESASGAGYQVIRTGQNPAWLNDKPLIRDKGYLLSDGDILKVEAYSMLVSTLESPAQAAPDTTEDVFADPAFSLDLEEEETDFLEESEPQPLSGGDTPFSHKNVLSDDPFAADPFEDIEEEKVAPHVEAQPVDDFTRSAPESDLQVIPHNPETTQGIEASLEKLLSLTQKNQQYLQNPALHHEALFEALEQTVDQFLQEFSPAELEGQFSEYMGGGLFKSKEKRYWRIYRKHFLRKQKNGDFKRQFKALFLENMQKQREEE